MYILRYSQSFMIHEYFLLRSHPAIKKMLDAAFEELTANIENFPLDKEFNVH